MLKSILFRSKVGELMLNLLERKAGLSVVESRWLGDQISGSPAHGCNRTPGLEQTQGANPVSKKILAQSTVIDKALKRGFAFLVAPSPDGESVFVTLYTPDNRACNNFRGLLPGALATINQAAELAHEMPLEAE